MLHALPLVALAAAGASAKSYNLHRYSGGQNFFDGWVYPGSYDTTNNSPSADLTNSGDNWICAYLPVGWLVSDSVAANRTYAQSAGLTTVNAAGNAVLKVDNTSPVVYNDKRSVPSCHSGMCVHMWLADIQSGSRAPSSTPSVLSSLWTPVRTVVPGAC